MQLRQFLDALFDGGQVTIGHDADEVYSARSEKVTLHARAPGPADRPIAVFSGRYPDQFAVCTVTGKIQVFQVPEARQ